MYRPYCRPDVVGPVEAALGADYDSARQGYPDRETRHPSQLARFMICHFFFAVPNILEPHLRA
jgi:hypothetical protein